MDLKVHTLWGIHAYKKDRSTQDIKCSPWETKVQSFPSLEKKMAEIMRHRQIITTPFTNRSFQPRPKVAARKYKLVPCTGPNRAKLSQHRKINARPPPEATQWNWLANLRKAKDPAGITTSWAPAPSQPMDTPSTQSSTSPISPECTKYHTICTPVGKICP